MSMSDYSTAVTPDDTDVITSTVVSSIENLLPKHTLEMTSSLVKRGRLKNIDKLNRTHYIKLDCKIKNESGNTVQVFNRFILLDSVLSH